LDIPLKQLYYAGIDISHWIDKPKLAVVGSRKISPYGQQTTDTLVSQIAMNDIVIISGLAYGVDAVAHRAALKCGGTTVAVLPTAIENIYPPSHQNLANQILSSGALLSEYSSADPVYKTNFTDRNRIVAGLADAVLITEAAINSGSLHTARFALNQGKTVLAVPGNITSSTSTGCNNLIKSGAIPVTELSDVLFAMRINPSKKTERHFRGSEQEHKVFNLIAAGVHDQEELALKADINGSVAGSIFISLEINGYIKPLGAGKWVLNR
jgi:DNA processing protein